MNRKKLKAMREELTRIAARHGGQLKPEDVVREAKSPRSILHGIFVWDDSRAAHKYRLWQAREFIANVEYRFQVEEHTYSAPEWVRDPRLNGSTQGYVAIGALHGDKNLARDALVNEFGRAGAHLSRAYDLARALKFRPAQVDTIARRVRMLAEHAARIDN